MTLTLTVCYTEWQLLDSSVEGNAVYKLDPDGAEVMRIASRINVTESESLRHE
jgi:hypothetical protein